MHPSTFIDDTGRNPDAHESICPLRVVIAYNNRTAGFRAMRMMGDLGRSNGNDGDFHPILWPFELLADEDWGQLAADDALRADVLIIATSCENPLPAAVGRWAESTIRRKQGTAAVVVVLFGSEEHPDGRDSSRLKVIQTAARGAGIEFFASATPHEPAV